MQAEDELQEEPPLSPEEKVRRAEEDVARLTRYGVLLSVFAVLVSGVAWLLGAPGAEPFAKGIAVGCAVAVLNLRLLARAGWRLLDGQQVLAALGGFGASFLLLVIAGLWLVLAHPDWLLGFGVGLALPAAVGLWYGLALTRRET